MINTQPEQCLLALIGLVGYLYCTNSKSINIDPVYGLVQGCSSNIRILNKILSKTADPIDIL